MHVIPTPYTASLGGNTSIYESKGGKRRKTFRRTRRFTGRKHNGRNGNKSTKCTKSVFGFLGF